MRAYAEAQRQVSADVQKNLVDGAVAAVREHFTSADAKAVSKGIDEAIALVADPSAAGKTADQVQTLFKQHFAQAKKAAGGKAAKLSAAEQAQVAEKIDAFKRQFHMEN